MSITETFVGKWKLIESVNYDEYMKIVGVSLLTRKQSKFDHPVKEIRVNDGKWKIVSVSANKTNTINFELDKEFNDVSPDGLPMKSTMTLTPEGKLVQQQKEKSRTDDRVRDSMFTHYVEGDKLIKLCESQGVLAKRIYERIVE